ncbi:hypothetical protein [Arthrobacter pityocampae]|uniref:hypothetical protein n=1 Tax=Arthrobacter pityocampae TaxID=547334 RepID=UPI003735D19A
MTEASEEHRSTGHGSADATERNPSSAHPAGSDAPSAESRPVGRSRALVGPFTLREVLFAGGVLVVFIGTLLPFIDGIVRSENFWNTAPLFFVGIGILLPVIALALLSGRRLGSSGLRVGSLSVDQFASVSAVLATLFFFLQTVTDFHYGPLVALIGALIMLAATVVAPFLPVLKDDFADRPETPAHPVARAITAAQPRPAKPEAPAREKQASAKAGDTKAGDTKAGDTKAAVTDAPATDAPASGSAASGSAASAFRFGRKDKSEVNPAAAPVLQNGAGLYGAGGAGAVGAGAAASGQSGMEPGTARSSAAPAPAADDASTDTSTDASTDPSTDSVHTGDDGSADRTAVASAHGSVPSADLSEPSAGGAHAVDSHDAAPGSGESEGSSTAVQASSVDETRIHDVVRDEPTPAETAQPTPTAQPAEERNRQEPITATRSAVDEELVVEAFWFAVGSPRPVFDEQTDRQVFVLQPGDWEVGIEDRGTEFLVQDKRTGFVGILRDLRNIERAPQD